MGPKMTLEPSFLESFFTCGPRPRPWPHFCPLWGHFWSSKAPFWRHVAPFWPHWGPLFLPPQLPFSHHMPSEISEHHFLEHPSGSSNNLRRLLDTADVLEICANRFLEHRTSHTDMITSSKLVHTGDVLEFFDDSFLEHLTSHTDMNTSSKFVHTRYHTLGGGRCLRRKALTIMNQR